MATGIDYADDEGYWEKKDIASTTMPAGQQQPQRPRTVVVMPVEATKLYNSLITKHSMDRGQKY